MYVLEARRETRDVCTLLELGDPLTRVKDETSFTISFTVSRERRERFAAGEKREDVEGSGPLGTTGAETGSFRVFAKCTQINLGVRVVSPGQDQRTTPDPEVDQTSDKTRWPTSNRRR